MSVAQSSPIADPNALSRASEQRELPELLAPAGDWECARAAVENGADAIYFGLEKFNARMRARNFTEADLPKLMEFLHGRGVRGFVAFNTLVFANEMADAERHLCAIIGAGVDAAIVQDIGICRLIRSLSPDFPIHASTQMTITSAGGVEFARELGCHRVVLARECSLKEIERIQAGADGVSQPADRQSQLPLEVFVHGALCVAYSGQCLTSEALGGRSANRGECAQACRMPYELICDGKPVPLGDRHYLLSPQDLAGVEVLPELFRAGVASLKIEGRLKSPEYVANITRIYRKALDELLTRRDSDAHDNLAPPRRRSSPDQRYDLEMAFSRGLYTGWFQGINNQELVHARFGKKRGVYLGEVSEIQSDRVLVKLEAPLKPGDGVVFDSGHPDQKEEGGRVYQVRVLPPSRNETGMGSSAELGFGSGDLDRSRIHAGDKLWKTSDPELDRRLRQSFDGDRPKFLRPIDVEVHGCVGQSLTLTANDSSGHVVQVHSRTRLMEAKRQPLTAERLREQLGRLGGTPFRLGELRNRLEGEVILPVSELNRLRREAVTELEALRAKPRRWTLNPAPIGTGSFTVASTPERQGSDDARGDRSNASELTVLVRSLKQLEAVLRGDVQTVYCEFADPKTYREAVKTFRASHSPPNLASGIPHPASSPSIFVAPPRIFKTGEDWILKQVQSSDADGYLVRNYDHLKFFANSRRIGDFSLNVANSLAADYFIRRQGLERLTASYDLNITQLEALLRSVPPEWIEVTLHQHMPMFHMEHCVFCAFLSRGTDYTNCGRPCDQHEVKLRDRVGAEHPLAADVGCRNTMFNARAQTGAEFVTRMIALGVRYFRIEFLKETADEVAQTIVKYRQLLRGEITGAQLWRELKLFSQLGVTRGQIANA